MPRSRVFVFVVLLTGLFFTTTTVSSNMQHNKHGVQNFTYIGTVKGPEHLDTQGSTRAISYFITDSGYLQTQKEAQDDCRNIFSGRLATIYTREQNDLIRDRIAELDAGREQIFTAGKFNIYTTRWEWITTETETYFEDWAINEPTQETTTSCIVLLGESSSFGWRSRECGNKNRFICEISI